MIFVNQKKKSQKIEIMKITKLLLAIFVFIITLFTTSCEKYQDGVAGRVFMSVSWSNDEPDYIETGNSNFPTSFFYDDYYETTPGIYTIYYEGVFWNGSANAKYSWEVDYELWISPGESARSTRDGLNGLDNYFNIDLSPYGPYTSMTNKRMSNNESNIEVLEPGVYRIIKKSNEYNIKITYKNVTKTK
jgi:hypothetical protein